ncbi:ATP-dependent DNA helicase homolog RECG, chloroplastic-like isoform X2 [Chenopodium quinoa]|uniref:ATP-dependent DNA helicase homolog RECG, chloroplastic-like isoform X2 n=1 Tax=Chenopodium quinoa TaxID=63459 RepID=UPI000B77E1D6|nr:ATP-dependent DNA helicase homolog RECG, chloroplastic-like isoform X2 [Chenopodium quinoa]
MMSTFNFAENCLRAAIVVEVESGYRNILRRKMRYNQVLVSKISKFCYRSKHKVSGKLFEDVNNYGVGRIPDCPKYKVSVMLGYSNLDGLVNKKTHKESGFVLEDKTNSFDVSFTCKKFPSICIGSLPRVELYDDSAWDSQMKTYSPVLSCEEFQPLLTDGKWMVPETLTETGPPLNSRLPDKSFSSEETSSSSSFQSQSDGLEDQQLAFSSPIESLAPAVLENDKLSWSILDKPISSIKGLSKRHSRQLEECDFHTLRKLLHHFPRTYADLQNSHMGIEDGQYLIFVGRIMTSRAVKASYSLSFLEVVVRGEVDHMLNDEVEQDETKNEGKKSIYLHLKKFFRGPRFTSQGFLWCLKKKHREGDIVCVSGKVKGTSKEDHYEMREYSLDVIENEDDPSVPIEGRPYPIYSSKGGLKPQFFRDIMTRALQSLPTNIDPIPQDITIDIGLQGLHDAYIAIHQPKDLNDADLARRRLIFDEFFYLQLGRMYQLLEGLGSRIEKEGLLEKYRNLEQSSIFSEEWCDLTKSYIEALPYSLTKSQLSAVSEIIWDLKQAVPMNRLLQGDVGCGKTVVAFLACMEVIGSGYQAAYMVPTELLAIQHYDDISNLLEKMESDRKPSIALLTGSTSVKQARMIRNELQAGTISMVIGTHSLIAESVEFLALRLAVIDEQHRFGVIQRGRFNSKLCSGIGSAAFGGTQKSEIRMAPHILAMSATPIPRSLAFVLYGDVSLTQITGMPPGRLPIETRIVEGDKEGIETVYKMMHHELEGGGKVYVVYPIIDQSENLPQLRAASGEFDTICSQFPNYSCGLLHGRMKCDEKDKALRCFRDGDTQILLSTQVIETGIDVPDASMMVVMNAERFGMAQLHQLRGRVGRGARKSTCVLVASAASSLSRLKVLEQSADGFHLAKVDLFLRGPGDLLGKKQSGHLPDFPITRLEIDGSIIQDAHVAALKILSASHNLEQYTELKAELSIRQPLSILGD